MSTTPLTDAIEALTRYANETTGASDTTLSDAVGTLVAGYGGGGGGTDTLVDFLESLTSLQQGLRGQELPESVIFTSLTNTLTYSLAGITGCKTIVLPALATIGEFTFADNKSIETYDLGPSTPSSFSNYMFSGSTTMKTLILRKSSVVGMAGIQVLNQTCFASNGSSVGGTLYVPQALISSYQSASNWSTILGYAKNSIQAIEGSYYETHYADGTVIE